jgi:hypothetical protein
LSFGWSSRSNISSWFQWFGLGLPEWIGSQWTAWGSAVWIGHNWNGVGPNTCIRALILGHTTKFLIDHSALPPRLHTNSMPDPHFENLRPNFAMLSAAPSAREILQQQVASTAEFQQVLKQTTRAVRKAYNHGGRRDAGLRSKRSWVVRRLI